MLKRLWNLFRDEKGQDMIEYALLTAFLSIVAIAILIVIAPLIQGIYQAVANALTSAP